MRVFGIQTWSHSAGHSPWQMLTQMPSQHVTFRKEKVCAAACGSSDLVAHHLMLRAACPGAGASAGLEQHA
jgi:hypothetical protein